jgi:hypothetical protein
MPPRAAHSAPGRGAGRHPADDLHVPAQAPARVAASPGTCRRKPPARAAGPRRIAASPGRIAGPRSYRRKPP